MDMDMDLLLKILVLIVGLGISIKIIKTVGSIIFKVACILLMAILFYTYFL